MYYDQIRHRHSQVLAATGLTPVEFDALLVTFKYHWDEYYSHFTLEGKVRQRISYNRKTSVLPLIQDKMFFILVYDLLFNMWPESLLVLRDSIEPLNL